MNTKNFKNHLNKLVRVFASIEEDGEITNLERDLLKKYVVNLYEALTQEEKSDSKSNLGSSSKSKADRVEEPIVAVLETPKVVVQQELMAEPLVPVVETRSIVEPKVDPTPIEKVVQVVEEVKVEKPFKIPSDLAEIFEEEKASEISEKLGLSKVKDIGKAMGINEKIFTITELFGGDQVLFNDTVKTINDCGTYAEASQYICESVARTKNWAEPDKAKKAKQFVKLVQRKFS